MTAGRAAAGAEGPSPFRAAAPGRGHADGRAHAPMKCRLADACWGLLEGMRLADISVGDVAEAAGVSRGSLYYHFADLDALLDWAVRRELFDSDGRGNSFVLLASRREPPEETPEMARALRRVCLLLDRGGMGVVYRAALDAMLALWGRALRPGGGELPDKLVSELEYAVGGTVGMLSRANASSEAKRRVSVGFVHAQHLRILRVASQVLGEPPAALLERLEAARGDLARDEGDAGAAGADAGRSPQVA